MALKIVGIIMLILSGMILSQLMFWQNPDCFAKQYDVIMVTLMLISFGLVVAFATWVILDNQEDVKDPHPEHTMD